MFNTYVYIYIYTHMCVYVGMHPKAVTGPALQCPDVRYEASYSAGCRRVEKKSSTSIPRFRCWSFGVAGPRLLYNLGFSSMLSDLTQHDNFTLSYSATATLTEAPKLINCLTSRPMAATPRPREYRRVCLLRGAASRSYGDFRRTFKSSSKESCFVAKVKDFEVFSGELLEVHRSRQRQSCSKCLCCIALPRSFCS